MVLAVVFGLVVVVMICGGMLLARLVTAAKSKGSWVWGFRRSHRTCLYSTFPNRALRLVPPLYRDITETIQSVLIW